MEKMREEIPSPEQEPKSSTRVIVYLGARMQKIAEGGKVDWVFPVVNEKPQGKFGGLPVEISGVVLE